MIFIQIVTQVIGELYFISLDKIMFCKICSIGINEKLLYDQNNSNVHRDFEDSFY